MKQIAFILIAFIAFGCGSIKKVFIDYDKAPTEIIEENAYLGYYQLPHELDSGMTEEEFPLPWLLHDSGGDVIWVKTFVFDHPTTSCYVNVMMDLEGYRPAMWQELLAYAMVSKHRKTFLLISLGHPNYISEYVPSMRVDKNGAIKFCLTQNNGYWGAGYMFLGVRKSFYSF